MKILIEIKKTKSGSYYVGGEIEDKEKSEIRAYVYKDIQKMAINTMKTLFYLNDKKNERERHNTKDSRD